MIKRILYVSPLIEFALLFAFVNSLFMPEGLSPKTQWLEPYFNIAEIVLTLLLCIIVPIICGILLWKNIKKEGWKQNILTSLLTVTHIAYPAFFLYEYCERKRLYPAIFDSYLEYTAITISVLWVFCFFIYILWLGYQHNKQLEQPKRETK